MPGDGVALAGEAQEVALAEAQAVLALVADEERRRRLADLVAQIGDGRVADEDAEDLAEILELALQSGRVRALYGPGAETATLAAFRRLPRGAALTASAEAVTSAARALAGKPIERLVLTSAGPGAYQLAIAAGGAELTVRLDRQGARVTTVAV